MGTGCTSNRPEELKKEDSEDLKEGFKKVPDRDEYIKILPLNPKFSWVPKENNLQKVMPFFMKQRTLGQGASSEVTHVIRKRDDVEFAMKIMKRDDKWNPILFKQEYDLLTVLKHDNILGYRTCYMDPVNFYFCTELCKGGELFDKIKEMKKFSETQAASYLATIISAIGHCHSMNIVHRDLKPENIVFRTKEQKQLVIIDFGDAKIVKEDAVYEDFVGTAFYLAPECVRNRTGEELKKSDMWTIGVIAYVLLTGRPPFFGRDNREILKKIIAAKVVFPKRSNLSNSAKDFILKLIKKNPATRMSAAEALDHPWLKGEAGTEDLGKDLIDSLSNYASVSKLKKVLVRLLANQMSESDKKALKFQFDSMDTDGDGMINCEELGAYLEKQGYDSRSAIRTATNIIAQLDQDGDGQISRAEWQDARLSTKFQEESIIRAQFQRIDKNGDGYITHDELATLFGGQLGTDLIKQMIAEIDLNNDGKISYEEFVKAMKEGCIKHALSPRKVDTKLASQFAKDLEEEENKTQ